jgi:hypothetical protein
MKKDPHRVIMKVCVIKENVKKIEQKRWKEKKEK